MKISYILICMAIMAVITYLCRVLTMVLVRKKIENVFLKSVLTYIPFGVLAAMVFPAVFYSTSCLVSAILGVVVALILSFFKRGLLTVALSTTATVFLTELIFTLTGVL